MRKYITLLLSLTWLINGLFCKVLNLVPRHHQIVSEITHSDYSYQITILIGILEILMSVWIISGIKLKLNVITQITAVLVMNIIEFFIASHLLLWGNFNLLFALIFITIVYLNYIATANKNKEYDILS